MAKKQDEMPQWVSDEIQNAEFGGPERLGRSGYILEFYPEDRKMDVQLYEPVEDGRHIVTVDVPGSIDLEGLARGEVYEFAFDQHRAPLGGKVTEFLAAEKGIEMSAIYRFELVSLELLDVGSESGGEDDDAE